ncbi:MAG: hypothetical protein MJZ68_02470 [archaeon]|nr:hypothetical protein [archaeon]
MKKIMTILVAIMIVAVAGAVISTSDDAQASVAGGNVNISVYDGHSWAVYSGTGYNAYQALMSVTGLNVVGDGDYVKQYTNSYGTYDDLNPDYGKVTAVGDVANGDSAVWNVAYYKGNEWKVATCTLGYISPFADAFCSSANVALYYGDIVLSEVEDHASTSANLITPAETTDYRYSFNIKVSSDTTPDIAEGTSVIIKQGTRYVPITLTANMLVNGVTIYGYGSNAYAALKDAVGVANIVGEESYATYYGWIVSLFGLGTVSSGSNYIYWNQYIAPNTYSSFSMGYYSTITGVPADGYNMVAGAFVLDYVLYSWI